jgi:hypothetical protein
MAYPTGGLAVLVSMAPDAAVVPPRTGYCRLVGVTGALISPAIGIPAQQITLLSFRFSALVSLR